MIPEKNPSGFMAAIKGVEQIIRFPVSSLFFILLVSFALFLSTIFCVLWKNMDSINNQWDESNEISLYLKKSVDIEKANKIVEELKSDPLVSKVELIEQEEGMKNFVKETLLDTLLSSFKKNPLPHVIIIYPKVRLLSEKAISTFVAELKSNSAVASVKLDSDWIDKSYKLLHLFYKIILVLGLIFGVNALLVICSMSYFMSRFLASSCDIKENVLQFQFAWYGVLSGLFAILFTYLALVFLKLHNVLLVGLGVPGWLAVVFVSVFFSFFSSRFAASCHH